MSTNLGKVLVTGADGFLGSHLVETLAARGHDLRAFVHYSSMNSWGWLDHTAANLRSQFEVFPGDIRDAHCVHQAMLGCDTVFHLAALIAIPYSYHAPEAYVETNVKGTLNVVQAARDLGVRKVVHTSTSEVYGTAQSVPITEDHPLQSQSPYSASKIGADQIALSFHRSFGTPVAIIRPFNTYGPRQSARAVIPAIIIQIASNASAVKLGSVHPTRDFSYVRDTIEGFIAVASSDRSVGHVINIGSNFEISISETVDLIAEVMDRKVIIETDDRRVRPKNSEVERLWASNTKAHDLLGWQPAFAGRDGLRRGLEKTVAWFANQTNLRMYKSDEYNI